jgi:hypothetical protein
VAIASKSKFSSAYAGPLAVLVVPTKGELDIAERALAVIGG